MLVFMCSGSGALPVCEFSLSTLESKNELVYPHRVFDLK